MRLTYLKNTVKLNVDDAKCIGCGMCTEVCPHSVFIMENKKSVIIDKDACMECGACEMNCPVFAVKSGKGVGCAAAVYSGLINKTEPSCGCGSGDKGSCC